MSGSKSVLFVSPFQPDEGVRHAGGVFVNKFDDSLRSLGYRVAYLVGDSVPVNDVDELSAAHSIIDGRKNVVISIVRRFLNWRYRLMSGYLISCSMPYFGYEILRSKLIKQIVRRHDYVFIQWEENARIAPFVKLVHPKVKIVVAIHDVLEQRYGRMVDSGKLSFPFSLLNKIYIFSINLNLLLFADSLVVISDKDKRLLWSLLQKKARVIPPFYERKSQSEHQVSEIVLHYGWYYRSENVESLMILLDRMWPVISTAVPSATLRIVGDDLPEAIIEQVSDTENCCYVGYVDDIDSELSQSLVHVSPLMQGAGVKFKNLDTLLAGVPTVTTSIGAEGIGGEDYFAVVSDDVDELAAGVIDVLQNPESYIEKSRLVAEELGDHYSREKFCQRLKEVFRG